jgi:predicted dehydrogenase
MRPVTLLIVGAGGRGAVYADYAAEFPQEARVVGVAEPRDFYRRRLAEKHRLPAPHVFADWREAAEVPRTADAVVIGTQDAMHTGPALAFADLGYHMLLEKPMAPTAAECRRIVDAVVKAGIIFAVGHIMRYTPYTQAVKSLVDSGAIGDIVNIQHLEPVGYWHQAHSFVRGNWRNERESSFMLLAKSCHDLDWIRYVMGERCVKVSSFGTLKHFRREKQPEGAADRCCECRVEPTCPYSAMKIYLGRAARGHFGWPVDTLTADLTVEGVTEALHTGPYGRCVYACDNDVVDNQVVNMLFAGGQTASFTMTAFNKHMNRHTRVFGTRGDLCGDGNRIEHHDFLTDATTPVDVEKMQGTIVGGHGGADHAFLSRFIAAVQSNDPSQVLSGPLETLESHLMVFAAEQSRWEGRVVDVHPWAVG